MKGARGWFLTVFLFTSLLAYGQVEKLTIQAGTPEDEDKDLNAISSEQDPQKKVEMYQDFLSKYASNPAAVAYGNWQLSEYYRNTGDLQKAIECGDKAVAGSPRNLEILTSRVILAQQAKDNARAFKYSVQGGEVYDSIEK